MKRSELFDTIFDECLGRAIAGEGLDAILADHPADADELRPLLETVIQAREATDIKPRQEFKRQAFYDFQAAVRDLPQKSSFGWSSLRHWWVTAVAVLAVVIFGGGGTALAAQDSLPDSSLYAVKLATENVRLAFTFSDEGKAELYAAFTEERVDEIVAMAGAGNAEGVNRATENLDRQLVAMVETVMVKAEGGTTGDAMLAMSAPQTTTATMTQTATAAATVVPTTTATATVAPEPEQEEEILGAEQETATITVPSQAEMAGGTAEAGGLRAQQGRDEVMQAQQAEEAFNASIQSGQAKGLEKEVLEQAAMANSRILELLETVPEEVREALLEALAVLNSGYGNVISNMK